MAFGQAGVMREELLWQMRAFAHDSQPICVNFHLLSIAGEDKVVGSAQLFEQMPRDLSSGRAIIAIAAANGSSP